MEGGYYDFTGLDSLKRNMTASKEWVSNLFPSETPLIAKAATSWVPDAIIFVNPSFDPSYGAAYPGASYVTNGTDQLDYLTRNALCCLEETPPGYMPGMYVETYDPWGNTGTVANVPSLSETGFRNAIAVYAGATTLSSLFQCDRARHRAGG